MFRDLSSAVAYCHDLGFCHRDLKCENILLAADMSVRLTDFGFARPIEYDENGEVVLSNTFCQGVLESLISYLRLKFSKTF